MSLLDDVAGVILIGGSSQRMRKYLQEQQPHLHHKSQLPLHPHTHQNILDVVLTKAQQCVDPIVLSCNIPDDFADYELIKLPDAETWEGPLAGIATALRWIKENTSKHFLATFPGDSPLFPLSVVPKLLSHSNKNNVAVSVARYGDQISPLFGVWHISAADKLEKYLNEGNTRVIQFLHGLGAGELDFSALKDDKENWEFAIDPFFNINTPSDYEAFIADPETALLLGA